MRWRICSRQKAADFSDGAKTRAVVSFNQQSTFPNNVSQPLHPIRRHTTRCSSPLFLDRIVTAVWGLGVHVGKDLSTAVEKGFEACWLASGRGIYYEFHGVEMGIYLLVWGCWGSCVLPPRFLTSIYLSLHPQRDFSFGIQITYVLSLLYY